MSPKEVDHEGEIVLTDRVNLACYQRPSPPRAKPARQNGALDGERLRRDDGKAGNENGVWRLGFTEVEEGAQLDVNGREEFHIVACVARGHQKRIS